MTRMNQELFRLSINEMRFLKDPTQFSLVYQRVLKYRIKRKVIRMLVLLDYILSKDDSYLKGAYIEAIKNLINALVDTYDKFAKKQGETTIREKLAEIKHNPSQ